MNIYISHKSVKMLASRAVKPKLSISIAPVATQQSRPVLSLKSPITPLAPLRSPLRSPLSPLPLSPTSRNTKLNQRGFASMSQQPTYMYSNNGTKRSILKKTQSAAARQQQQRQLSFSETPVVHHVSPIEEPDYYGGYTKMTREERRWQRRD